MADKIAIICITKNGINIARKIKTKIPAAQIFAQSKHNDFKDDVFWFDEPASSLIAEIFKNFDSLVCIFSLGAVIRLISNLIFDKKSDPAVLVIDDKANFVISALSGHLGGANELTHRIANFLDSQPVITTAADVNETIAVDLVGNEFGWIIENFENVTRISGLMVNHDEIGVYQDSGERDWMKIKKMPHNVTLLKSIEEVKSTRFKGCLVITDKKINDQKVLEKSVIYRPKSLVVGLGLHWNTTEDEIKEGITKVFDLNGLLFTSIRNICSINRKGIPESLESFSEKYNIPLKLFEKETLDAVHVPNPSELVKKFEGTASVSEASSIISSKGSLIIPKQKFPPSLTIAVCRVNFGA